MTGQEDALLITLSQSQIKKQGYKNIAKEWEKIDGDPLTWWYKMATAPKHLDRIIWVYWIVKGRIRWRCRYVGIEKDKAMEFGNRPGEHYAKVWLILVDFERIPRSEQVEQKGIRGFRYWRSPK